MVYASVRSLHVLFTRLSVEPTGRCDVECERRMNVVRLQRAVRRLRQVVNRRRRRHSSHTFTVRSHRHRYLRHYWRRDAVCLSVCW